MKANKAKDKKSAKIKTTQGEIRKRQSINAVKKQKTTSLSKKNASSNLPLAEPEKLDTQMSPNIIDEFAIANAWEILGDEEYILDDSIWNTLYSRVKLQLLQTTYSFKVENEGTTLSPYAVTPMPAFRAESAPGYLQAGSFTILRPELPGVVFDLKITSGASSLLLDWQLLRKDTKSGTGHIALYINGILVEAANLQQSRCRLALQREDIGDATFYFLDADTGRQAKILELNL
ncbi:MAG TPA: hypothetical protein PLY93_01040 [Turneriella sp.]|nr:hypothetical protein [Turneriella sp.]